MTNLIIQIESATSGREIDHIVGSYINKINPCNRLFFCHYANFIKIRISRKLQDAKDSFKTFEKN